MKEQSFAQGKLYESRKLAGPLYEQVRNLLRQRILDLEWPPGRLMPNELQLAHEIGVSIGTIRKALGALEEEQLIVRKRGRGTQVVDGADESQLLRFTNVFADEKKLNIPVRSVARSRGEANAEEANLLEVNEGEPVIRLSRRLSMPARITGLEVITVASAVFPGLDEIQDLTAPTLFGVYRHDFHVLVDGARESVCAINAEPEIAASLGVKPEQAVLKTVRVARALNVGPVELSVRYLQLLDASYVTNF